ncbi:hypothetical protein QQZ08_007673 [Neonectria magnoliae]|uniref:2EXR domain-containing protein n=1 Tax=Neonectria magnoliae TaxID=2732573 RepID=A0ABR1HYE7_9HYPO
MDNPSSDKDKPQDESPEEDTSSVVVGRDASFPQFPGLPGEIRNMIWEKLVDPTTVNFFDYGEMDAFKSYAYRLSLVNREARSLVLRSHTVRFCTIPKMCNIRMDPVRDTFFTLLHYFPTLMAMPGRDLPYYPFRKVLSAWDSMPFHGTDYHRLPLGPFVLTSFPDLREYTLTSDRGYNYESIKGYQMYGPDIVGEQDDDMLWGRRDNEDGYREEAERFFQDKGLSSFADTGLRWPIDSPWDTIRNAADVAAAEILEYKTWWWLKYHPSPYPLTWKHMTWKQFVPRIGFYGYSWNDTSMGGEWAGFRYYTATQRVEFSPLAYWEVVDQLNTLENAHKPLPDLVVRVWIIRPGEEAPENQPHHAWETVLSREEDDDTVSMTRNSIRTLWQMTRLTWNENKSFASRSHISSTAQGGGPILVFDNNHAPAA